MSKFLLNLLLQISKALLNSKIQFLFGNLFFLDFLAWPTPRPAWPLAQPAHRPHHPSRPKSPDRPIQPARRSRLHGKYVFLFRSRLLPLSASSSPPRRPTQAGNPLRRRSPRSPLRASDAVKPLPPPHHFPFNPLQTEP